MIFLTKSVLSQKRQKQTIENRVGYAVCNAMTNEICLLLNETCML